MPNKEIQKIDLKNSFAIMEDGKCVGFRFGGKDYKIEASTGELKIGYVADDDLVTLKPLTATDSIQIGNQYYNIRVSSIANGGIVIEDTANEEDLFSITSDVYGNVIITPTHNMKFNGNIEGVSPKIKTISHWDEEGERPDAYYTCGDGVLYIRINNTKISLIDSLSIKGNNFKILILPRNNEGNLLIDVFLQYNNMIQICEEIGAYEGGDNPDNYFSIELIDDFFTFDITEDLTIRFYEGNNTLYLAL